MSEYDVKSTLSSEDDKSNHSFVHGHDESFEVMQRILSVKVIGKTIQHKQRILVESVFKGLLGEQTTLFQIPCLMSEDCSTFFVYLNEMDSLKFNKTVLFNLVDTAEKTSDKCNKIVFVFSKSNTTKFAEMEKMFSLIDAKRLSITEMQDVCNNNKFLEVQKDFALFELEL